LDSQLISYGEGSVEHPRGISNAIYSSRFCRIIDDSLKDEDNVAWVMRLPTVEREAWTTILEWVRVPDRLLERDRFEPQAGSDGYAFKDFASDWRNLREHRIVSPNSPFAGLFRRLRSYWDREKITESMLKTWDLYLTSLERYIRPRKEIAGLREYRKALYGLSGTFFQAFPYAPIQFMKEVGVFGTLDQFFNNLRDLYEDTIRGICYYPISLLERFQIEPQELPRLVHEPNRRFVRLNEFLLSSFASGLQTQMKPLLTANSVHPSWKICMQHTINRYERIEYFVRLCHFNVRLFRAAYWEDVQNKFSKETALRA